MRITASYILFLASVVSVAIITTTVAPMPSVGEVFKSALKAVAPLTNGLDNGLTKSAGQLQTEDDEDDDDLDEPTGQSQTSVNSVGKALNSVTSGLGSIVQGADAGLGDTLKVLPHGLFTSTG